jgi:hypothetical protein
MKKISNQKKAEAFNNWLDRVALQCEFATETVGIMNGEQKTAAQQHLIAALTSMCHLYPSLSTSDEFVPFITELKLENVSWAALRAVRKQHNVEKADNGECEFTQAMIDEARELDAKNSVTAEDSSGSRTLN